MAAGVLAMSFRSCQAIGRRRSIGRLLRRLRRAIPVAAMPTTVAGSAFAQNWTMYARTKSR